MTGFAVMISDAMCWTALLIKSFVSDLMLDAF
jgi:hypothetical protein